MSRTSDTDHPSQLGLDRLLAGETQGTEDLRAHLDTCARCQERYQALRAEQRAHMTEARVAARVDALANALEVPAAAGALRTWWPRWRLWTPLAMGAALALLLLWLRHPDGAGVVHPRAGTLKNPPAFQVLVIAPDAPPDSTPHEYKDDSLLAFGTEIEFRAGCADRCTVLLAALGHADPATLVDDEHAPGPWQLVPAQWNRLPVRLALQSDIRLFALFCEAAPPPESLLDALARHYPGPQRDLGRTPPEAPAGCVLRSVRVRVDVH